MVNMYINLLFNINNILYSKAVLSVHRDKKASTTTGGMERMESVAAGGCIKSQGREIQPLNKV